jgi:hypothetical protein
MKLLVMTVALFLQPTFFSQSEPTLIFSDSVEILSVEVRDITPRVFEPTATFSSSEAIPEIDPTPNPCVEISNASELLCYPEYEDRNYRYFRELAADGKTAIVMRYNSITQKREALYSGEVEHILWVKDGYAALMIGGLGRVYVIPGEFSNSTPINFSLTLNIVALTTQQVIYSTPAHWIGPQSSIWAPTAFFLTPDWLHIDRRYYSDVNQVGVAKNSLLHLKTGEVRELDGLLGGRNSSLGNGWYVMTPPGNYEFLTRISLYNLNTHETVPIVSTGGMMDTSVGLAILSDSEFQITVREWAYDDNPYGYRAVRETVYVVRINGVELS